MRAAFLEAVFKIGATKFCPKFAYGSRLPQFMGAGVLNSGGYDCATVIQSWILVINAGFVEGLVCF